MTASVTARSGRVQSVWRRSRSFCARFHPLASYIITSYCLTAQSAFSQLETLLCIYITLNELFLESDNGPLRVFKDWNLHLRYILQMLQLPVHILQEKLLLLLPSWLQ